jgi:hypothetical protein
MEKFDLPVSFGTEYKCATIASLYFSKILHSPMKTIASMCQHPEMVTLQQTKEYLTICHRPNFPRRLRASSTSIHEARFVLIRENPTGWRSGGGKNPSVAARLTPAQLDAVAKLSDASEKGSPFTVNMLPLIHHNRLTLIATYRTILRSSY